MLIRIKDGPMFLEDYVFITPVQSGTEVPGLIDEKKTSQVFTLQFKILTYRINHLLANVTELIFVWQYQALL